ncbi:MAG: hypothetical protein DYG89_51020 [Caldilinea sp. CFX5]|nr:hypothetical protein [Caldilinea sp. CFX5]
MNQPKHSHRAISMVAAVVVLLAISLSSAAPALAKATVIHEKYAVPVDEIIYSDCAGEAIHFTGAFHVAAHTTMDENGGFHTTFVGNDHNVTAVGLSTGAIYRRVGVTHVSDNFSGQLPYQTSYTNSFSFIGRGMAANTLEIDIVRLHIDENGVSTIVFENRILECK